MPTPADPTIRGATELVRFLEDMGQQHVFGLPGSSMVSILDALEDSAVEYVPGVHEAAVMAMADGYARVTGSAYALLYMMPGTANAMANLYNAWRDESPVVVLATQQASGFRTGTATIGEADMSETTAPFTRLSREVQPGMLSFWLGRAARAAAGPPSGPAFLALPEDVLENDETQHHEARGGFRQPSAPADVSSVVEALGRAERPVLMVGGQVRRHGGADIVERIAEQFEIPVVLEPAWNDRLSISPGHTHAFTSLLSADGRRLERGADVVLAVGCRLVCQAHPRGTPWFPAADFLAHVNTDVAKLDELQTADWSCACDPAEFLRSVLHACEQSRSSPEQLARRRRWIDEVRSAQPGPVAPYGEPAAALHDALEHGWVVDESVTGTPAVIASLTSGDASRYVGNTGYSLGWGASAACGVAVGSGDPVTCTLGDGSLLFGAQGLWTAATLSLPITYLVWDNHGYGSTRMYDRLYRKSLGEGTTGSPEYIGSDFRGAPRPADVLGGFGIPSRSLRPGDDLGAALAEARSSGGGPRGIVVELEFEG